MEVLLPLLGGMFLGAAAHWMLTVERSPYASWLGKICWVRPLGRADWTPHVIVAVSWKGAVCVRPKVDMRTDGYWIKKQNVRWRVRWEEPTE